MKKQPLKILPRKDRFYVLTKLGLEANLEFTKQQIERDFADFCIGCLRVKSKCSCPLNERKS